MRPILIEPERDNGTILDLEPNRKPAAKFDFPMSPIHEERPDLFRRSLGVVAFVPGQMYSTGAGVFVEAGKVEEVTFRQDEVDKVI